MKRFLCLSLLMCLQFFMAKAHDVREAYDIVWEGESGAKPVSIALKQTSCNVELQEFVFKGKAWKATKNKALIEVGEGESISGFFGCIELENSSRIAVFSLLESLGGGRELNYRLVSVDLKTHQLFDLTFSGKNLKDPSLLPDVFQIEGTSNFELLPDSLAPAVLALKDIASKDERLIELPQSIYLSDKAIELWLDNNPDALKGAKSFVPSLIPDGASLVEDFAKAAKEKNKRFETAVITTRGYSVIVARLIRDSRFLLVWAENAPKDKATDRYIRNFYFEDENTLAVLYYKGKSVFKKRLNLASREIR